MEEMPSLGSYQMPKTGGLRMPRVPSMEVFKTEYRPPPPIRPFTIRPIGPRALHLGSKPRNISGGPGDPPMGFVGPHTSATEWIIYWALAKIFHDPVDPRKPPFIGSRNGVWTYQTEESGGRNTPGASVTDFVVTFNGKTIGIRLETERWHIYQTATVQMRDFYLRTHVRANDNVVSIYDQDFIGDPTGHAACVVVANAIKGDVLGSPQGSGTGRRIRI